MISLASYTTLGLGGPARSFVSATTETAVIAAVREADASGAPLLVLGGGSNLVVADEGFDGVVVHMATRGVAITDDATHVHVTAQAGEAWDALVAQVVAAGCSGVECLSGIPGLVGATPIQNVGAYGQEVSDTITAVRVYDRRCHEVRTMTPSECAFGYRDSVFKHQERDRYVVLDVRFALRRHGAPSVRYGELSRALEDIEAPSLEDVRETVLRLRRAKSMVLDANDPETRSAGSFFMNPRVDAAKADAIEAQARALGRLRDGERMPRFEAPGGAVKLAAGWLIERAGIARGERLGAVAVSRAHALALVNHGGTSRELVALARSVRSRVEATWGVTLSAEPVFAGFAMRDPVAAT
jgi:UDP-N-acetylmuramate dehydrogenase